MNKKYVFDGVEYATQQSVRQAIFNKSRKAFGKPKNAEEWAKHGVTYIEEDEPVQVLREWKCNAIKSAFLIWREKNATIVSSLGFKVDSNERANTDVSGLLVAYENNQDALITFRDADNEFHSLTYAQVKTLQKEIIANGNYAYEQKWMLEAQVEKATTKEELDAIKIEFVGKDFTKE